ncbi:CatA-like O-acetyltransferase [Paraglaciecola sp.]|uniref:CatA-like O-acetyltransferase n=1 Tax=Paraglaciecola sp. TaxID=1920173 RepID=UPI003264BCEA
MDSIKQIDIDTWHRKQHFEFYSTFSQPFFNICATVDVSQTLVFCKDNDLSFFICSLFILGYTANQIEPLRLRVNNNKVELHDELDISCTVLNNNQSFGFCDFGKCQEFKTFYHNAEQQISHLKKHNSPLMTADSKANSIFCSVLPWLHFTSFSHAQKQSEHDSIPRIVMGKFKKKHKEVIMPVSVEVHHALVDGLHVGQYFEKLQHNFDNFFTDKKKPDNYQA